MRSCDAKQTTESKDIVEIKPQQQVKPKLKCQGRINTKKETETDINKEDVVNEKPDHKMEEAAEKPEVSEATLCEKMQTLITESQGEIDTRSNIDTLKGIIALLQNSGEKAPDLCKKDIEESNTDNGQGVPTDKSDSSDKGVPTSEDNVVNYDLKVKIDSDTDVEMSKLRSVVLDVIDKMVHKIDDEIKQEDNKLPEPDSSGLHSGPIGNIEDIKKPAEIACTDTVSDKVKESVALQCDVKLRDVEINKDEEPVEPCPVYGTKPHDAVDTVKDTGAGDIPVADTSQLPGNVKVEAPAVETGFPPVYIKDDESLIAEGTEKNMKMANFAEKLNICEDKGVMKNTCAQLDDTVSADTLVIDESDEEHHPTSNIEGMQVSVTTGHVLAISGESCKVGEMSLEDQEGFECTPHRCSQMPHVDPYKRNLAAGNVNERYTALELPTSVYLLM